MWAISSLLPMKMKWASRLFHIRTETFGPLFLKTITGFTISGVKTLPLMEAYVKDFLKLLLHFLQHVDILLVFLTSAHLEQ